MSRLWTCGCGRTVNPFVNGDRCPSCGGRRDRQPLVDAAKDGGAA